MRPLPISPAGVIAIETVSNRELIERTEKQIIEAMQAQTPHQLDHSKLLYDVLEQRLGGLEDNSPSTNGMLLGDDISKGFSVIGYSINRKTDEDEGRNRKIINTNLEYITGIHIHDFPLVANNQISPEAKRLIFGMNQLFCGNYEVFFSDIKPDNPGLVLTGIKQNKQPRIIELIVAKQNSERADVILNTSVMLGPAIQYITSTNENWSTLFHIRVEEALKSHELTQELRQVVSSASEFTNRAADLFEEYTSDIPLTTARNALYIR